MGFRSFVSALMLARPVASWAVSRGGRAFHRGSNALLAVGQISVADLKVCALILAYRQSSIINVY